MSPSSLNTILIWNLLATCPGQQHLNLSGKGETIVSITTGYPELPQLTEAVAVPGSSAGIDLKSQLNGEGSIASCYDTADRLRPSVTRGAIRTWLATCENAAHRRLDEDDLVYRPIPAWELPENSFTEDELRGEWMIPG